jgi:outer membrane murein-binding lipoprotein Lpp
MKMTLGAAIIAAIVVTGCADPSRQLRFDGQYFRTKVSKVDKQQDVFTVRIRDVARSLEGAREAGRHAGNSYCIQNYGSSKIDWAVGPDTPPETLQIEDNTLIFQGVCPQV